MRTVLLVLVTLVANMLSLHSSLLAQGLQPGDTLLYGLDMLPADPGVAEQNKQGYWNMTTLNTPFLKQLVVRESRNGELVLNGVEGFAHKIAINGDAMFFSGVQAKIAGVPVWSKNGIKLPWRPDIDNGKGEWFTGVAEFAVPLKVLAAFPDRIVSLADSAKVVCSWETFVKRDEDGSLELEKKNMFEAYRHNHQKKVTVTTRIKRNGAWSDYPIELDVQLPICLREGTTFYFWDQDMSAPLAVIEEDIQGRASRAAFMSLVPVGKRIVESVPEGPDILVNANPSFGNVRFELFNLEGPHRIEIYSIIGVLLRTFELDATGSFSYPVSLTDLNKGTYIYRLVDAFDKTIKSKRLVIITP